MSAGHAEEDPLAADIRFERAIADALRGPEPARAFETIANDESHPSDLREALRHAPANGVRIAALLIVRLRFERIQQASKVAAEFFATDPRGFTAAFRRFHDEVPPMALQPFQDARDFEAWLDMSRSE